MTFAIMLMMLCCVDLINPHCWICLTIAFLPCSITGPCIKPCTPMFMPKFASFSILGPLSPENRSVHPIGVSERSCLCCVLWIESHNRIFGTRWMTSETHGEPCANWALPGAACPYAIKADGNSSIDKAVLEAVDNLLVDALDWLFPGQRIRTTRRALTKNKRGWHWNKIWLN